MKLKIEPYDCLCELSAFEVNEIEADYSDFGGKYDRSPDTAEDYCCGDMQFEGIESTPEVLKKYNISQSEYDEVVEELTMALSFGSCGWCS
jgi:hypothetical protein